MVRRQFKFPSNSFSEDTTNPLKVIIFISGKPQEARPVEKQTQKQIPLRMRTLRNARTLQEQFRQGI